MSIAVVTPPDATKPPITPALLKLHLSILPEETDFDALLEMYLASAVDEFTAITKRCVQNTVVRQTFDRFPCETYFRLERAPLVAFDSIEYRDTSGNWVEFAAENYTTDPLESEPIVQLKRNKSWPSSGVDEDGFNAVRVNYTAGYGETEDQIPFDIKRILCMIVGDSYLYREDSDARPGAGLVIVNPSSANGMKKYKLNFFEHKSQKAKWERAA